MITKKELAKKIKTTVTWLIQEDCGCSTIKLDDTLAVCVGWLDGYDKNDKTVLHSKTEPTWCINAGIKVWTSDSIRTDFEFINAPYYENGDVWDTNISISQDENYETLADWFLKEYKTLSTYEIEDDGKIIGHKNPWICNHCLKAIESHEGKQTIETHYVDKNESTCEWCHESGFDTLYEIK